MSGYFIFDGKDSRDYEIPVFFRSVDDVPEPEYEKYSVAGRNGDLVISRNRYSNIDHVYDMVTYGDNHDLLREFISDLASVKGYKRLTDSFNTAEFYRARFKGIYEMNTWRDRDSSRFELQFDRDPRRFLITGEIKQTVPNNGSISNPTAFPAKPLIRVTGYGTLTVGSDVITISNNFTYVDIDSEIGDCYHGTDNANASVSFQQNDFPELAPGATGIAYSGNITKVEITPRWWRL